MTIKPLGKRILAKKIIQEDEKTTGHGIIIPNTVQNERVVNAKVLAIGTDEEFCIKVGDEIIVGVFAGTEIEDGDDKLILVKESDVLAVIEE